MQFTALFCDKAEAGENGKLSIYGVFSELYAPDFPARQKQIVIAGVVQWEHDDNGRRPFRIDLTHPDGQSIFTVDGYTDVEARPQSRPPARTLLILPLENVVFPSPGRYVLRASIHGQECDGPALFLMRSAEESAT